MTILMDLERNNLMRSCWVWAGINSRDCLERHEPGGHDAEGERANGSREGRGEVKGRFGAMSTGQIIALPRFVGCISVALCFELLGPTTRSDRGRIQRRRSAVDVGF